MNPTATKTCISLFLFGMPVKKGGTLETYIVRIYRRGRTIPHRLVGIVEQGGAPGRQAFTCLDELWDILKLQKDQKSSGKQKKPEPKMKGDLHALEKDR